MHSLRRVGPSALLISVLALLPAALSQPAGAQERELVLHQVTVSSNEAGILLEFDDGAELSVSFQNGRVLTNDREVGSYEPGGRLDASWRALLRDAVGLENSELLELVGSWTPPSGLEGDAAETARELQNHMASTLEAPPAAPQPPVVMGPEGQMQDLMQALLTRGDRLRALASAVRNLQPDQVRVHVGEDVQVPAGDTVRGTLLVLDGDLELDGRVEGDVLVLGGNVELGDESRITGDLRWNEGSVRGERDAVVGRIEEVEPVPDRPEADLRDEIRTEIRDAMQSARTEARSATRSSRGFGAWSILRNFGTGILELFQTLLSFALLFGIGLAALAFIPRHFEVVARTARNATGRSALVGLASAVLAFPIWIVGIVLLAVTIIGIPVMLLWLPLFPAALALAGLLGYLAVARNAGRWLGERRVQGLDALDGGRPAVQLGFGLAVLLGAFALAAVFQMGGGLFSPFRILVSVLGALISAFAVLVGVGAVVLSRGGRDPLYAGPGWSYAGEGDPWAPEPDPFEEEPGPSEPEAGRSRGGQADAPGEDADGGHTGDDSSEPEPPHER